MKNNYIKKICILFIKDKKLLLVYKPKIGVYITPGGKVDANESDLECLNREIKEELGCSVSDLIYFEKFYGNILESSENLELICYLGNIDGRLTINPDDTINGFIWIDRNYKHKKIPLGPMLDLEIIPRLIDRGLL